MSDLQCAATIIVARHGEAEYDTNAVSDAGGSLTLLGRQQARELAETLQARKIATVWCSDMARAVQTAEIAAGVLGCGVRVRSGLREFGAGELAGGAYTDQPFVDLLAQWEQGNLDVGPPGAESGADVVRRFSAELDGLADQYRGETSLVISHGGAMTMALPRLARNVGAGFGWGQRIDNCATCELVVDSDGWIIRTWRGKVL